MCFAFDARPPELPADLALPPIAGGAGAEVLELDLRRRHALLRRARRVARGTRPGRAHPPRRARPVPLLHGARRALRRRRPPRDRDRLLRPHRRARAARRGLRLHAARRADARSSRSRPTPRPRSRRCASAPAPRRVVSVGFCFGGMQSFLAATNAELGLAGVDRLLRHARRLALRASTAPLQPRGEIALPGARACSAAPTRRSRSSRSRSSTPPRRGRRRARDLTSTRAHRTRSSTARRASTRRHARTRGGACSASSRAAHRAEQRSAARVLSLDHPGSAG